jgi:hypothetical protein
VTLGLFNDCASTVVLTYNQIRLIASHCTSQAVDFAASILESPSRYRANKMDSIMYNTLHSPCFGTNHLTLLFYRGNKYVISLLADAVVLNTQLALLSA